MISLKIIRQVMLRSKSNIKQKNWICAPTLKTEAVDGGGLDFKLESKSYPVSFNGGNRPKSKFGTSDVFPKGHWTLYNL